jgi:hypothetical protein
MIGMTVDTSALQTLGRALGAEADGKKLRRDLAKNMRTALAPAVAQAQSGIKSMSSGGLPHTGPPLRAAIARQVKAEARLSGRSTGARVKARKKSMPRGFANAPKRTNSHKGWRRQVYGRGAWVTQRGRPGWFDEPMKRNAKQYRAAVLAAMEQAAKRISGGL